MSRSSCARYRMTSSTMVLRSYCAQSMPKPEVAAGQRTLDDDVIRQAVEARALAQEQRQRAQRRHDDAELHVAKTRMILDQRERAQMQTRAQRDAVDAAVHRGRQAHAQRLARAVHRELFHGVDEDQAIAPLGLHGPADVQPGRLGQPVEIEMHHRTCRGWRRCTCISSACPSTKRGLEAPVGNGRHHRIRDMADAAEPRRDQRQFGGGNIDAHAAGDDGHQFLLAEAQPKIVDALHSAPITAGLPPQGIRALEAPAMFAATM